MYGFEVEDSESKGRMSKLRHFIRQKRLFATKGYFPCGIGIEILLACLVLSVDGAENHPDVIYLMKMKIFLLMKNATPQSKSKFYSVDSTLVRDWSSICSRSYER